MWHYANNFSTTETTIFYKQLFMKAYKLYNNYTCFKKLQFIILKWTNVWRLYNVAIKSKLS